MKVYFAPLAALLLQAIAPALHACAPLSPEPRSVICHDSLPGASPGKGKPSYPRNSIKLNASSLFLHNYSFTYERMLTRKISFVGGYRFMPKTKLGDISVIRKIVERVAEDGDGIKDDMNKITLSNSAFTGELRFYMGRKPGARGFYLSLYGRYAQFNIDYDYEYEGNAKNYVIPIKAPVKIWGGGLMVGAQWLICRRVTLDWYIMGGHTGSIKGDATGAADLSGMSASEKADVKDDMESFFNVGDKQYINAAVTDQGVQARVDGPMFGLRGAGINIGIAF